MTLQICTNFSWTAQCTQSLIHKYKAKFEYINVLTERDHPKLRYKPKGTNHCIVFSSFRQTASPCYGLQSMRLDHLRGNLTDSHRWINMRTEHGLIGYPMSVAEEQPSISDGGSMCDHLIFNRIYIYQFLFFIFLLK